MANRFHLILLCLFAAQAAVSDDPLANLKAGQPGDVKKLIDRLAGCTHWSGEEPYDAERKTDFVGYERFAMWPAREGLCGSAETLRQTAKGIKGVAAGERIKLITNYSPHQHIGFGSVPVGRDRW